MSQEPGKATRTRLGSLARALLARPDIGTTVSLLGVLVALLALMVGRGYPLDLALRPRLEYTHYQLSTDSKTLSACTIQNNGRSNARDIVVHLWIDQQDTLFDELNIQSEEGNAEIRAGGIGKTYAYIYLERLVKTHSVTVTASTLAPVTFHCRVADDGGPGQMILQDPFVLRPADFIVLLSTGCLLAAVVILTVHWLQRSRKAESMRNEQEDGSSTT